MIYLVIIGLAVLNLRIRTYFHAQNGNTEEGKLWDLLSIVAIAFAVTRIYLEYIAV